MKKSEFKKAIKEEIIEILSEAETADDINDKAKAQAELNKELEKTKELTSEADDDEPTTSQLKGDSVSKLGNKLQQTTAEMKRVVKKWKDAEGAEKAKLTDRLRELTKIKKEIESLLQ
tara:strand:- start:845 stop:1198 length:354 start_codon:yes stop_codon:yes gene_type:complete